VKIKAEQLQAHLHKSVEKNQLSPMFIISGDEPLLSQEAADSIRGTARQLGYTERTTFHVEGKFDWNQLLSETSSLSLFAEKRILEVRIPSGKPGDQGSKALCELCENLTTDHLLLVILPKLERATQNSKWFKTLDASGVHIPVWPVKIHQLPQWIKGRLNQAGIEAGNEAAQILAERVEGNLLAAMQEIDKLKLLAIEGRVDSAAVSAAVTDSARYDLFEFIDKVLAGDSQWVARALRGLQNEGADPLKLLWAITRELRVLVKARQQVSSGKSADWALKKLGVWDSRISQFRSALRRLSPAHLRMLLYQAGAIDRGVKGLRKADVWDEITTLILSLSGSQTLSPANIKMLVTQ